MPSVKGEREQEAISKLSFFMLFAKSRWYCCILFLKIKSTIYTACRVYTKGLCDSERGRDSLTDGGRIDAIDGDNPYARELLNSSLQGMERSVVRMKIQIQQARLWVSISLHLFFQTLSANTVLGLTDSEVRRNRSPPSRGWQSSRVWLPTTPLSLWLSSVSQSKEEITLIKDT